MTAGLVQIVLVSRDSWLNIPIALSNEKGALQVSLDAKGGTTQAGAMVGSVPKSCPDFVKLIPARKACLKPALTLIGIDNL